VKTTGWPLLAIGALLLGGCTATPPQPERAPVAAVPTAPPDARVAQSDELMASMFDPTLPGCSAAVGVHGEVIWAGAVGTADLASGAALTTATRFDIASLTKQFTATAVLMLQRQGLLSLSDPIGRYVPGLPSTVRSITLDALMHHTSHIPDYWVKLGEWGYGFTTPATQADAVRAIAAVSRLDKGTGYVYSNSNYIRLAEVITAVSGVPYAQYLDDTIFTPLGLKLQIDPVLQAPDIAVGYDDDTQPTRNAWAFYGAFGTFTTPTELAIWGDQYRDGSDVIGNDFVTGAVDSGKPGEASEGRVYAAGMNINADGSLRHDGRMGGFISAIKVSPDRESTVVVMCNAHLADRSGVVDGLWKIWVDPDPGGD
jgi:CubicO group peptidase (beta-lactamase class C family)